MSVPAHSAVPLAPQRSPLPYSALRTVDAEANAKKRHGTQVGDPRRGAQAMFDLALQAEPPLRIVLGSDAFAAIEGKLKTYGENVEKGKKISLSTDVDEDKKVKA